MTNEKTDDEHPEYDSCIEIPVAKQVVFKFGKPKKMEFEFIGDEDYEKEKIRLSPGHRYNKDERMTLTEAIECAMHYGADARIRHWAWKNELHWTIVDKRAFVASNGGSFSCLNNLKLLCDPDWEVIVPVKTELTAISPSNLGTMKKFEIVGTAWNEIDFYVTLYYDQNNQDAIQFASDKLDSSVNKLPLCELAHVSLIIAAGDSLPALSFDTCNDSPQKTCYYIAREVLETLKLDSAKKAIYNIAALEKAISEVLTAHQDDLQNSHTNEEKTK